MSALDRWSERKRRVAEAETEREARERAPDARGTDGAATGADAASVPPAGTPEREAAPAANREAAEAIDLDALRPGADMSAFFREGVPEALRRRALKALWRSDPVFANVDRLCDYDDDFRAASMVPGVIQSAWRAGRGYVFPEEDEGAGVEVEGPPTMPSEPDDPSIAAVGGGSDGGEAPRDEPSPGAAAESALPDVTATRVAAPPPDAGTDDAGTDDRPFAVPSLRERLGV